MNDIGEGPVGGLLTVGDEIQAEVEHRSDGLGKPTPPLRAPLPRGDVCCSPPRRGGPELVEGLGWVPFRITRASRGRDDWLGDHPVERTGGGAYSFLPMRPAR